MAAVVNGERVEPIGNESDMTVGQYVRHLADSALQWVGGHLAEIRDIYNTPYEFSWANPDFQGHQTIFAVNQEDSEGRRHVDILLGENMIMNGLRRVMRRQTDKEQPAQTDEAAEVVTVTADGVTDSDDYRDIVARMEELEEHNVARRQVMVRDESFTFSMNGWHTAIRDSEERLQRAIKAHDVSSIEREERSLVSLRAHRDAARVAMENHYDILSAAEMHAKAASLLLTHAVAVEQPDASESAEQVIDMRDNVAIEDADTLVLPHITNVVERILAPVPVLTPRRPIPAHFMVVE